MYMHKAIIRKSKLFDDEVLECALRDAKFHTCLSFGYLGKGNFFHSGILE